MSRKLLLINPAMATDVSLPKRQVSLPKRQVSLPKRQVGAGLYAHLAVFRPPNMTPAQLEEGLLWAAKAISSRGVTARRALHTWRATRNPLMVAPGLSWNRSGLYQRIVNHRGKTLHLRRFSFPKREASS